MCVVTVPVAAADEDATCMVAAQGKLVVGLSNGSIAVYERKAGQTEPAATLDWSRAHVLPKLVLLHSVSLSDSGAISSIRYISGLDYLVVSTGYTVHVLVFATLKPVQSWTENGVVTCLEAYSASDDNAVRNAFSAPQRTPPVDSGNELELSSKLDRIDAYSLYKSSLYDHDPFAASSLEPPKLAEQDSGLSCCVYVVHRRLWVCRWTELGQLSRHVTRLPSAVANVAFLSPHRLVLASNGEFLVVDVATGTVLPHALELPLAPATVSFAASILGPKQLPTFFVRLVHRNQLLVCQGPHNVKIDATTGELRNQSHVVWDATPRSVKLLFPYLVVLTAHHLEVRDAQSGCVVQKTAISGGGVLETDILNGLVYLKLHEKSKKPTILCCKTQPFVDQLNSLENEGLLDEAVSLTFQLSEDLLPDKVSRLRQLQIKKATAMFNKAISGHKPSSSQLQESMSIFSSFLAPPDKVLSLFPKFLSGTASSLDIHNSISDLTLADLQFPKDSSHSEFLSGSSTPSTPQRGLSSDARSIISTRSTSDSITANRRRLLAAVQGLLPYLADTRRKILKMLQFEQSKSSMSSTDEYSNFNLYWQNQILPLDIFGDLAKSAELVDTTLFNCYILTAPMLIGPLFRIENHCRVSVVERKLLPRRGRKSGVVHGMFYKEMVDFYYGKKMHEKALSLLRQLSESNDEEEEKAELTMAKNETPIGSPQIVSGDSSYDSSGGASSGGDSSGCDGDYDDDTATLILTNKKIIYQTSPASTLRGPLTTIQYLLKLNQENINLIFEYIKWPMEIVPEKAMVVFLNDSAENESLDAAQVTEFLLTFFEKDPVKQRRFVIAYLEHALDDLNVTTPKLHTKYLEMLLLSEINHDDSTVSSYDKLVAFLSSTYHYEPHTSLRIIEKIGGVDDKYVFLQSLIYKRLKEHLKVLEIFVEQMKQFQKAMEYCNDLYNNNKKLGRHWFHQLLDMMVKNGEIEAAVELLKLHGLKMSVSYILGSLPSTIPISTLESILISQFNNQATQLANSRSKSALSQVEYIKNQEKLLELQSKSVVVTQGSRCGQCGRPLGGSVLGVFKNGDVTHYGCAEEYDRARYRKKEVKEKRVIAFGDE